MRAPSSSMPRRRAAGAIPGAMLPPSISITTAATPQKISKGLIGAGNNLFEWISN